MHVLAFRGRENDERKKFEYTRNTLREVCSNELRNEARFATLTHPVEAMALLVGRKLPSLCRFDMMVEEDTVIVEACVGEGGGATLH